jgi:GntR family transcriptional repressor for pyruvate dehydrogenase complex
MEQTRNSIDDFAKADFHFHHELAVISRNTLILGCYNLIGDLMRSAFKDIVRVRGPSQGLYFHTAILERICEHDATGCRELMTEHIDDTYNELVSRKYSVKS